MRDRVKKNAVMCDGAGKGRTGGRFCAAKSPSRAYFSSIFCLIILKKARKELIAIDVCIVTNRNKQEAP